MAGFLSGAFGQGLLSAGRTIGGWLAGSGIASKAASYLLPKANELFSKFSSKAGQAASKYGLGNEVESGLNKLYGQGVSKIRGTAEKWLSNVGQIPQPKTNDAQLVPPGASTGAAYKQMLDGNTNKLTGNEDTQMQDSGNPTSRGLGQTMSDPANKMGQ